MQQVVKSSQTNQELNSKVTESNLKKRVANPKAFDKHKVSPKVRVEF